MVNVGWQIILSRQAEKDAKKLSSSNLKPKAEKLLKALQENPFYTSPSSYEKLSVDLKGYYTRRINKQHRLVYEVLENRRVVHVLRMWTHYE